MARQARCKKCHIHYIFDGEVKLAGARCPKCGELLRRTTRLTKDKIVVVVRKDDIDY